MAETETEFDKRRTPYVPMDVMLAFGDFGTKLIERWGMEGIAGWMLFLAACKREPIQGRFTYTSDAEGWAKLGATATGYTLDEFFTFTGRCKKTSRTRHGRVRYVQVRQWDKWNTPPGNRRKPRKQAENADGLHENTPTLVEITPHEVEVEAEQEEELLTAEAEAERYRLPAAAEIALEVDKLLKLRGCDGNSQAVLISYAQQLPLKTVRDIRQRAYDGQRSVRWAVGAMKRELGEAA